MSDLQHIATRRQELIKQAAQLRGELGNVAGQLQRPLAFVDKAYVMARGIRSRPGVAIAGATLLALVIVKRGGLGKLAGIVATAARFGLPIARFWLTRRPPRV